MKSLNVMMVAEKPSIARDIYTAVSNQNASNLKGKNVFRFKGNFFQHEANFIVTSVRGHVYSRDFPKELQNWERTNPLDLFEAETVKNSVDKGETQKNLKQSSQDLDVILLWLDNDKEGENISFEILETIHKNMKEHYFKQIYRVKFSSLVKRDLLNAFLNAEQSPNLNEALSVESRQIFDLKVGVAFTRLITLKLKKEFAKFKDKLVSYGPCQIPTLCLVVQRDKEIKNFVPQKYFTIDFYIKFDGQKYDESIKVKSKDDQNSFKTKQEAQEFIKSITTKGALQNVEEKKQKKIRPRGLNTVNMLKFVTKYLGMSSHEAMHNAEKLYLSGYITYPRTESTHYPNNFNFNNILENLINMKNSKYTQAARELKENGFHKPLKGEDAGDHPPIAPTDKIPENLNFDQQKIYDFVVSNFLQTISSDAEILKKEFILYFGEKKFSYENSTQINLGYLKIKEKKIIEENQSGNFHPQIGDKSIIVKSEIIERLTTPPKPMTESELLEKMEAFSIGTDASMSIHINNIIQRDYVKVEDSDRKMIPTDLGWTLIESLYEIDKEIVEPTLRGKVEKKMNKIAIGEKDFKNATVEILDLFRQKFIYFTENFDKLVDNLKKYYDSSEQVMDKGKNFGRCGKCKKFLSYADVLKKITCTNCRDWIYEFPSTIVQLCSNFCPIDNYPIIRYKVMLGLNEVEESELFDKKSSEKKDLIAKAKNFGVFIEMCCFCAFQFQQKKEHYFGIHKFKRSCDFCQSECYLGYEKNKESFYLLCCNDNCQNLIELVENVKNFNQVEEKCEKCQEQKYSITLKKEETFLNVCVFCDENLIKKQKKLGKHGKFKNFQNFRENHGNKRGGKRGKHKQFKLIIYVILITKRNSFISQKFSKICFKKILRRQKSLNFLINSIGI